MSLERARTMLAEAHTLADYVKVYNVAEDIVASLRVASNDAAEIQLLAAHAAGTFFAQMSKSKGGRPKNSRHVSGVSEYRRALNDTATPERTAQRWQQVAAIPIETVKEYIAARKEDPGELVSIAGLLRDARFFSYGEDGDDFPPFTEEEREAAERFADEHVGDAPHGYPPSPADRSKVSPDVLEEAAAVVAAGYKARARIHHPDHGGEGAAMTRVNLAVAFLRNAIEEGKAA